jgi:hypothetical protein
MKNDHDDQTNQPQNKLSIHIDKKQHFAPKEQMTGAELKALAGIAADYVLYHVVPGQKDDVKVKDADVVILKNGDHFYSVPGKLNPGGRDEIA